MDHENLRPVLLSQARAVALSMAVAGPVAIVAIACSSTTFPASDTGVQVEVKLGSGWMGSERLDHITVLAVSRDQAAVACFGPAGQVLMLSTGSAGDPCADQLALATPEPPTLGALPISTRADQTIRADLLFPAGEDVTVTAFAALAGSAVIGQPLGTVTGVARSIGGFTTLPLTLDKTFTPDPSCAPVMYTGPPAMTSSTPCGTAAEACFSETTDKPSAEGEHDPRVSCPRSGAGGFIVSGTASTCPIAWRHIQTGRQGCSTYALTMSFYRCVDGSLPDGEAEDGGSTCVRTTACTPPTTVLTATLGNVSTPSPDLGACVPPSVYPLSFTLPAAMSAYLDVSVTPAAAISGLPACDVAIDVLEELSSQTLGCNN